jgi:predicted  nucleic acid-binding Zn-ribbon protein
MPAKLPANIKSLVIQEWLKGGQRDKIAGDNGLSAGSVTNFVNEWRSALGFSSADDLRELAVTLRKIGITAAQCAAGFRVAMMMNRLGVIENNYESFMIHVYKRGNNLGLTPESIASYLTDLIEFSKTIPFSQMSEFIQQKAEEKKTLEQEIERLNEQIKKLNEEKSISEARRASALHEENMTTAELKSYSDLKKELGRHGIHIDDDLSKFAKVVHGISQELYDAGKVIKEFADLESLRTEYWSYQESIPNLKMKYDGLKKECSTLEQYVNSYNQTLSLYEELQAIGFGLKELKQLRNTINEIASANNIPKDQACQKFYNDIEEDYDYKLGFESKLDKLRSDIVTVNTNLNFSRKALLAQPLVGPSLQRLSSKGLVEQDIVELVNILFGRSHGDCAGGSSDIYKQSLMEGLKKYGGIISTIQELNQQADKLRNQIDELQRRKEGLEGQNQRMLSILAYSEPIVEFLHASDDRSFRNDNDNVKILAMIAFSLYILHLRYVGIEKPVDDDLNKLYVLLSRAVAAKGEEAVSIPELKIVIAKALRDLIAKLDTKTQADEELLY